jgi:hypothetical protein
MSRRSGARRLCLPAAIVPLVLAAFAAGCSSPDPKAALAVSEAETYWVVDAPSGATQYIAPAVRFRVTNKGANAWGSIQATATFRRKGEEGKSWGSDWKPVTAAGESLAPGASVLVVMRSDGRYYSTGDPESMFRHDLFRDAKVEVFLRIRASPWTKFLEMDVARHIGTRELSPGTASPAP